MLPPGPLQVERLPDGRRRLLRDLKLQVGEDVIKVPTGFVTDYSSWPRFLPGPRFSKIDIAGVVHDALFRWGRIGESKDARKVGYVEANRIWYEVARAGGHKDAKATWLGALVGRVGLFVGAWPTWMRYRRLDSEE
jgi:hypothetical protein